MPISFLAFYVADSKPKTLELTMSSSDNASLPDPKAVSGLESEILISDADSADERTPAERAAYEQLNNTHPLGLDLEWLPSDVADDLVHA